MSHVEWTVEEYELSRGHFPIRAFLGGLTNPRNANDAAALLMLLRARGNQLREPKSRRVADNLFELRGHQVRIFYMFRSGRTIVLLDGIVKKQDKIPSADVQRVQAYQRDVERRGSRAPAGKPAKE